MKPVINSIDPRNLKNHPTNQKVYGDVADEKFVEDCRSGIVEHLHITTDNVIISGHRRRQAAIKLGMEKVPVIVRTDLTDDLDIRHALILANKHRDKTVEQRAREGKELETIEAERAKRRQSATQIKDGKPPESTVRLNLDAPENKAKTEKNGRSDEKAAAAVGMSKDTLRKAVVVVDAIDEAEAEGDIETAEELRETLNTKSVSAAHKKATKPKEEQPMRHVLEEQITEDKQKLDPSKRPIPKGMEEIFAACKDFNAIGKMLDAVFAEVKKFVPGNDQPRTPGWEHFRFQQFEAAIRQAKAELKFSKPHTTCVNGMHKGPDCPLCRGTQFLVRDTMGRLSDLDKAKLPKEVK
jgi:ParB-like chromosome segregation protein Spo0J